VAFDIHQQHRPAVKTYTRLRNRDGQVKRFFDVSSRGTIGVPGVCVQQTTHTIAMCYPQLATSNRHHAPMEPNVRGLYQAQVDKVVGVTVVRAD